MLISGSLRLTPSPNQLIPSQLHLCHGILVSVFLRSTANKEKSMKSARCILALLIALSLGLTALAQSGRRPVYAGPTNGPGTASKTGSPTTSSPTNGTCPQGQFPGEYGELPTRTASTSSASSATSDPNAEEVLKIDTTLVTVPVSVVDRSGKFIPYLTRCDFHLYEDNVRQEIAEFSAVETPFNVVL